MALAAPLLFVLLFNQPPADPLAKAVAELDANRPQAALEILDPLVKQEPDNILAQFHLGFAYLLLGRDEPAIAAFRKCLTLKEDLYEARLNLARLLVKTRQIGEAVQLLELASAQRPQDPKPRYLLGRALLAEKKLPEAAAAFEQALALDPKDSDLALELAQLYEEQRQPAKAIELYKRVPPSPAVRERLGLLLLNQGDFAGAIENFEAVRAASPTPAVTYALATAYLRDKQSAKALELASELVRLEPSNVDTRLFLGRLLRDQKRYADAAAEFQQAVKLKPESTEAWNEFAGMLMLLKQYEPALLALDKARSLGGDTPAYHYFRATMLDALGRGKEALDSYRKFLSLSQDKYPDEEFKARQRVRILEKAAQR